MTGNDPPVARFFQLQRETISGTGELLERIVKVSAEGTERLSFGVQRELTAETVELARESTHQSLDAVEAVAGSTPADIEDARGAVDSAFDSLLDQQTQVFDGIETQSEELETETTAQIDEQVDLLLEATEKVEQQLTEAAEQFVEQAADSELTADLEEQLGEHAERFETIDISGPAE